MARKAKEADMNLYYMKNGQAKKETIEDVMKKKKAKEREKRIKNNKIKEEPKDEFDLETETVIKMTNRNKLKQEEAKRKENAKKQEKKKKKYKKIKLFLKIFLLLAIIIGGTIFAMTSPIFNIKDIEVINNSQVSSEMIISLSGLKTDENIFKFSGLSVEKKIKENAYVESVKIHRKIPNKIQIDVKERIPTYSVDFLGKYAYINTQGYIIDISEDKKELPVIQGVSTAEDQIIPNNRLNNEDLEKLEIIIKIMNVAKENNLDTKVTSIDISKANEYSIYLEEEQKTIYLGDGNNLSTKMIYIVAIIEKEKGNAGEIYANGELNNKFRPYFREKVNI